MRSRGDEGAKADPPSSSSSNSMTLVDMVEELGAEMTVIFSLAASPVVTDATRAVQQEAEETEPGVLGVGQAAEKAVCTAQVDARSRIRAGGRARLCVDVDRLHFFDPETEKVIAA